MDWKLLKQLSDTTGISGAEEDIAAIIREQLKDHCSEIKTDNLGNLICHIPGDGPKVLIDAHMDEVGFIISHIDKDGFIRVIPLGGIDPRVIYAQRMIIHGKRDVVGVVAAIPPHLTRGKKTDRNATVEIADAFIDTGLSGEKVHQLVSVGDLVSFDTKCIEDEDILIGKAFDDRIGIFLLIELGKTLSKLNCDLYLVGAVQEEKGLRGTRCSTFAVEPDIALALEGTVSNNLPGVPAHKTLAHTLKGPELRMTDGAFVADRKLVKFIAELAQKNEITHQIVVKSVGGTNAAAMQLTGKGVHSAAISVPVRYIHSPQGIVHKKDISEAYKLTRVFLENVEKFLS